MMVLCKRSWQVKCLTSALRSQRMKANCAVASADLVLLSLLSVAVGWLGRIGGMVHSGAAATPAVTSSFARLSPKVSNMITTATQPGCICYMTMLTICVHGKCNSSNRLPADVSPRLRVCRCCCLNPRTCHSMHRLHFDTCMISLVDHRPPYAEIEETHDTSKFLEVW
jgi:hypothetical protein